ncbi:EF-hand calcium-binding domain-containing protein 14 isoform X1 [Oxyura jamaicensis]|uniref:EF-hand calcium-binding domain-containing protein 14 isoform X1 n=1 Tax=Oxyura jamaicensis TaxID=8884 RepID=UPI0015A698A2|nr:EF-hand calcium-binding domain-containing protein 14 isoform X1 [Oxyura jamaicensis]
MKKRKELNALLGLAADGRRKKAAKKGSGHRLLRTEPPASDSESSSPEEEEEELGGARGRFAKGDYLRCCKLCYPLCAFVILAACVVACVGLVWMQVALKEDLDVIKEKFRTMESNQKTSFQEIPKLNEDLVQKQKQLEQIETGELGLSKIWINITEINKQISLLTSTVNHLKTNIKSASDLIYLPVTVEKLQKTVANIGSTLTSVSHDVENIQTAIEEYKKSMEILQNDVIFTCCYTNVEPWESSLLCDTEYCLWCNSLHCVLRMKELKQVTSFPSTVLPRTERNQTENCKQESQSLHAALEELNNSVVAYQKLNDIKLLNVDSAIGNLSRRVTLLENSPVAVNKLDKRDNLSTSAGNDTTTSLKVENEDQLDNETHSNKELKEPGTRDSQVLKLREKLQLISALTSKPENDRPIEASKNVESSLSTTTKPTDLSRLASRSADDNTEKNGQLRHLSLPGISSIEDLQNLFEKAPEDAEGKLSFEDLQKLFGSVAQESEIFKKFDTDGDEKYSLQELRLALGI